jgi:hypothetical protein
MKKRGRGRALASSKPGGRWRRDLELQSGGVTWLKRVKR